jgi:hypothetical protein
VAEDCTLWEVLWIDLQWSALIGVKTSVVVLIITVRVPSIISRSRSVGVNKTTFPGGVSAKRTTVVNSPSEDLVVVGQSHTVHASNCDLNHTDFLWSQQLIVTRALDVHWLLVADLLASHAELSICAFAEHVNFELLGWSKVDDGEDWGWLGWLNCLWCLCWLWS